MCVKFILKYLNFDLYPHISQEFTLEMTIRQLNKNKICIFFKMRLKKIFKKKRN